MGRDLRILVLSFYFRPDLSAGSFRVTALVDALQKLAPKPSTIDVITTLPNRYHSFTVDAPHTEKRPGLSIFRVALPTHKNGMVDQSKAFVFFSREVKNRVAKKKYDIVVASSSRLMTAVLAAWVATRVKAKLYLDIRDIFAENIGEIAPRGFSWIARPVFSLLERWAIGRAAAVNLVSPGFAPYFSARYPGQRLSYFTNGIDEEFLLPAPTVRAPVATPKDRPLLVVYAGNVGEGQGLHSIVPRLAKQIGSRVRFRIIGDGGQKRALETELSKLSVSSVELCPPMGRTELIEEYRAADVLFLHVNDYQAFKTVLPSKLFEYAAVGKPLWAGVSGFAADFIRSEVPNAAVFDPCDIEGAARSLDTLTIADTPRSTFRSKYARLAISRMMAGDILSVANGSR